MDPDAVNLPDLELLQQQIKIISNFQDSVDHLSPDLIRLLQAAHDHFQIGLQMLKGVVENISQNTEDQEDHLSTNSENLHTWPIAHQRSLTGETARQEKEDEEASTVKSLFQNDVSLQRKEFQSGLRENLQRLNFHINNTPLGVIEWDPQFRIIQWSKRAEEIFGWKAEEVIGRTYGSWLVYPEDLEKVHEVIYSFLVKDQQSHILSNRNLTKDGGIIYCEWRGSTLFNDNHEIVSILTFVLDVTERQLAESALLESEIKFRQFAENIREVFYMLPADFSTHIYGDFD